MGDRMTDDGLALSLVRIASDPGQVSDLHQILRVFCHQCRNLLNSLKISLYLARRAGVQVLPDTWGELEDRYGTVELLFDLLQTICRPMELAPVCLPFELLAEEKLDSWDKQFSERGRRLELVTPPRAVAIRYDPNWLGQAFDAFVGWRARAGEPGQSARLSWQTDGDLFRVDWREPECRGGLEVQGVTQGRPEPLALPLLARVVAAHGGGLDCSIQDGLYVGLRWPRDRHTS
jgi:hypothetical protein